MMVAIDCAEDIELASELQNYLKKHQYDAKIEGSSVMLNALDVEKVLESFLKESSRTEYSIRKIDSANLLLSKEVPIEDFGFLRCEMCGYVLSSEEELLVHRRAHGIQLL
ncbi:hypothetical protein [Candidatus Nitrosotalea bavarica]|uniref:hypothetical protein n=1 Tax=Candidatus Nitrosotalea bavarica TaxID=1903277 RepID=UPI000C70F4D7|nr:hypothetical protein [Candidatus Nitrosotalea bavarica]